MENSILVLGGGSSGKSMYAQRLAKKLAGNGPLFYLATMSPYDEEDRARIRKHLREREGWGFRTLEIPIRLEEALPVISGGTVLLDSVTSLLTNSMFLPDGEGRSSENRTAERIRQVADAAAHAVIVSDDLFSDGITYDEWTEDFRRQLGHIHQRTAAFCGSVMKLQNGIPTAWKGKDLLA